MTRALTALDHLKLTETAATARYMGLLRSMPDVYHRTREQQAEIDAALGEKLKAFYARVHHGVLS